MAKRRSDSKNYRNADGGAPLYAQLDINGDEQLVWGSGTDFEKSLKVKLVKELNFKFLGCGKDAIVSFLESTNQWTEERRGLVLDGRWNVLFAGIDWGAVGNLPPYLLLTDIPYNHQPTILESPGRTEIFLIFRHRSLAIRIECKAQDSSGTAEDKLFRPATELVKCGTEAWIVYTGKGFSRTTLKSFRLAVDEQNKMTVVAATMRGNDRNILKACSVEECLEAITKLAKEDIHDRCVRAGSDLSAAVS